MSNRFQVNFWHTWPIAVVNSEPQAQQGGAELPFTHVLEPDTSLHCQNMERGLVHRVEYRHTPPAFAGTHPAHPPRDGQAELSTEAAFSLRDVRNATSQSQDAELMQKISGNIEQFCGNF